MAIELFNRDAERVFLAALIKKPSLRADTSHVTPADLSPEANRVVLSAIDACIAAGAEVSVFSVSDRLNSLGVKLGGVLSPETYLESLSLVEVTDKAALERAKEVKRTSVRRLSHQIGKRIQEATEKDTQKSATEMVAEITAIFNEHVNLVEGTKENEPKDLYATMPAFVNNETTFDSGSIPSPFPLYNDLYGFFDPQSIYCWIARMKVGKSSFAMSMFQQMAMMDKGDDFRALVLDTEMSTEEVQSRILSSLSGVKEFYIRHKLYKQPKYRHMKAAVEKALDTMTPLWGRIEHLHIGGWDLQTQISATRRWAHKRLKGQSKRGIAALDYFKLGSSQDFSSKTSRDILLGGKVDAYKCAIKELNIPLVAFAQANREGEDTKQGARLSNSSVIAGSDMIAAFCSNIYLLEKLSAEERAALGQLTPESATHSLKLIAPRQLGPNELGNDCLVKYQVTPEGRSKPIDRWCENYLMLSFNQFVFSEVGTFKQLYERSRSLGVQVQSETPERGQML